MKKLKKKVLLYLLLTVCLVAVFTVNVFAEGWRMLENAYFDGFLYISESTQSKFTYRIPYATSENNNYSFLLDSTTVGDVVAFARAGSTFQLSSIQAGDKVTISPDGDFSGWFGGTANKLNSFAWALVKFDSEGAVPFSVLYRSSWYAVEKFDPNENGTFYRCPRRDVTLSIGKDYTNVFVALLFNVELETGNTFSINRATYDISWGDPNSPNAPNYSAPDDSSLQELEKAEDGIIDGVNGNLSDFELNAESFDSNLSTLDTGFTAARVLFERFFGLHDFSFLVMLLLQLGIIGFILNFGSTIVKIFSGK